MSVADSKPVTQEVNGKVIPPPLVFPGPKHFYPYEAEQPKLKEKTWLNYLWLYIKLLVLSKGGENKALVMIYSLGKKKVALERRMVYPQPPPS